MDSYDSHQSDPETPVPNLKPVKVKPPVSPGIPLATAATTSAVQRRIAIAVDLSDESAYAVKWAVNNYLRPGDEVVLLHVRPTSVLYGADWGATATAATAAPDQPSTPSRRKKLEEDFDNFITTKASHISQPLIDADVPFTIRIVRDHDMKERLCLEVERLGLSAMIMGSRGFGASTRRLGSVSDYCVRHCVCPVVVVRDFENACGGAAAAKVADDELVDLHPVPEEEVVEYVDAEE